ncbi:uncharacterized protein LOC113210653 [Frankliniella occidentalis]|uniref:Uncharacterized protein LOC113210653 n=1 Tax=Frankliniella occidentalis TaxID=133901 RepID=A0A9C6TTT9_FRAOC|nr:uncharacterized protein LOC113210653 [Frankliniella occidentalis]
MRPAMSAHLVLAAAMMVSMGLSTTSHIVRSRPEIPMSIGDRLIARVQYKEDHKAVLFYLCNPSNSTAVECDTRMWVFGANPEGQLRFDHFGGCEPTVNRCSHVVDNQKNVTGWVDFPAGENVFVVERRGEELAVWLQGHPETEHQAAGFAAAGPRTLRVKPWFSYYDMPVQFSSSEGKTMGGNKTGNL